MAADNFVQGLDVEPIRVQIVLSRAAPFHVLGMCVLTIELHDHQMLAATHHSVLCAGLNVHPIQA